jgi:hypothetical protein
MATSTKQKVIVQNPQNGTYLSEWPNVSNDIGCAIWSPHEGYARRLTMPEIEDLSANWPFLNTCVILPVSKGA